MFYYIIFLLIINIFLIPLINFKFNVNIGMLSFVLLNNSFLIIYKKCLQTFATLPYIFMHIFHFIHTCIVRWPSINIIPNISIVNVNIN